MKEPEDAKDHWGKTKNQTTSGWSGGGFGKSFYLGMGLALLAHVLAMYFMGYIKAGGQVKEYAVTQAKLVHIQPEEELEPIDETPAEQVPPETTDALQDVEDPLGAAEVGAVEALPAQQESVTDLSSDILSSLQDKLATVEDVGTRQLITGRITKQERESLMAKFGAGQAVRQIEGGVDEGLVFLAKQQEPEGCWSSGQINKNVGLTSLCLLSFVTGGFTPGAYGMRVNAAKAADFLLSKSVKDGDRAGQISSDHEIYSHAIATLALCETYSRLEDEEWRTKMKPAIEGAVNFLLKVQNTEKKPKVFNGPVDPKAKEYGGWRYEASSTESDLSVTGWCMMALAAARAIGVPVPKANIERGLRYVARCFTGAGFAYQPGGGPEPSMSAIGLLCLEMYGLGEHEMAQKAIQSIMNQLPDWNWGGRSFYYWYYGTQCAFHYSPVAWDAWRPAVTRALLENQKDDGSWGTSLMNVHEKALNEPQRVYATAMAILSLQIYYRHRPVYLKG